MIVVLIHIDTSCWGRRWYLCRHIYNKCETQGIETKRKFVNGGRALQIEAVKPDERFDAIVKEVLGA